MQILTKLILNNKIVEFRKPVRQSRVHCIRKLSRDIKKLREKKGTEEQKTKNQKKAGRYVEEIFIMKKLKDDEISKFALLNERTLNDITNDVNESLDKKALARLVHHKVVAEKVQNFRGMFPDWKNCLSLLLETLGEKYKYKKSNPGKESKKKKSRTPKIEKNSAVSDTNEDSSEKCSIEEVSAIEGVVDSYFLTKDNVENSAVSDTNEDSSEKCSIKEMSAIESGVDSHFLTKDNVENSAVSDTNEDSSEKCSIKEESTIEGAVDPFFLTKDNVEYVSISAKSIVSNPQEIKPKLHNQQEFNNDRRFKKREFKPYEYNRRESYDQRINKRESQFSNFGNRESSRNNRKYRRSEKISVEPPPTLHPSWEAKKKQSQLVNFEGKKVKFDDS